ncbi:MAG TPA: AAA family ATPase, partial [Sandaracinaceae bacterium]
LGAGVARLRELPLVGRAEERAELAAMVEEVLATGGTRLVAYVGEPGIGKSRLARWGLAYVEQTGTMDGAAGGYDPSGADVAGGLRHALRRVVGMPKGSVTEAWRWLAAEPGLDVDRLARFLRADEELDTVSADLVVHLAHLALRAAGRMRPIYLWLDDLGWARDGAIDLVSALLERDDCPVLLVVTLRPESMQHEGVRERLDRILRHPRARRRDLAPLSSDERARLLEHVAPLAPGVARALARRVHGSPLLLVQLVHDWLAKGWLEPHGGSYRPRGGASVEELLGDVEAPEPAVGGARDSRRDSVEDLASLMSDRVDALLAAFAAGADVAEGVLGRAALLGARFEHEALRFACARDRRLVRAVDEVLERALLVGLLRVEGAVYAFDHGLVQDALVARIEKRPDRARVLVDVANGLLARYGKERADISALVAGLLRRAGDHERAWERQLRAIERAAWASDDPAAQSFLAVAKAWAAEDPRWAARVEHAEARVHYFALRFDRALEAVARARALAPSGSVMQLVCDSTECEILFYSDRFAESERLARRLLDAATSENPEVVGIRAQACQRMAELSILRGDLEQAREWRERTLACAEATGQAWRVRVAKLNLGDALFALGREREALALCDEVIAEAKAERDRDGVAAGMEDRAHFEVLLGRGADRREYFEQRVLELEACHDAWRLSGALPFTTLLALEAGEDDASIEARVRRLVGVYRNAPNEGACTILALRRLASALESAGRFDLAREVDALIEERAAAHRAGFGAA